MTRSSDHHDFSTLRSCAADFLTQAFSELTELHVIPVPSHNRFIRLSVEYFGSDVMYSPEFKKFETELVKKFPARFDRSSADLDWEIASHYIFGLLEASIAEIAEVDKDFEAGATVIEPLVDELIGELESPTREIALCRVVTHVETDTGEPITVGGVTVIPISDGAFLPDIMSMVRREIPMAPQGFFPAPPITYDSPKALIVLRATSAGSPWSIKQGLFNDVERFLLSLRLITGATAHSSWEVTGSNHKVSDFRPQGRSFADDQVGFKFLRRVATLSGKHDAGYESLGRLISGVEVSREGKVLTSFDMALNRFMRSYSSDEKADQIVDLATSLEGILLGGDVGTEEVGLRLRSRASALLSTPGDSGSVIFRDIRDLYTVRSALVHGGSLKVKNLSASFRRILPGEAKPFGVDLALCVDRFRDIVRRAILARLFLANDPSSQWSFDDPPAVDAILADDEERARWRYQWRKGLTDIGLGWAADSLPLAADALTPHQPGPG